ncbi:MAG: serine protein kinase RIO [Thermoprotei archaeon]|nr:MAG: serine protein kinase RIO [Thermoprotei archaeon]
MREEFEEEIERLEYERIVKSKLVKIKDSELFETVEEVFDAKTLMALYNLMNKGVIKKMYGVVAAGKEARVYWAESPDGKDLAVKIFLVSTAEFRRGIMKYIDGDPRFRNIKKDRRHIIRIWCSKEFRNLRLAYSHGVRVPKPIDREENVLVMEFINMPGHRGVPAPLIKNYPPEDPNEAFEVIKGYIVKLYREARLVHADLSEYNIMHRDGEYIIIDWGSAVHAEHPNAKEFLFRDIKTIFGYFKRLGVEVSNPKEFFESLVEY